MSDFFSCVINELVDGFFGSSRSFVGRAPRCRFMMVFVRIAPSAVVEASIGKIGISLCNYWERDLAAYCQKIISKKDVSFSPRCK